MELWVMISWLFLTGDLSNGVPSSKWFRNLGNFNHFQIFEKLHLRVLSDKIIWKGPRFSYLQLLGWPPRLFWMSAAADFEAGFPNSSASNLATSVAALPLVSDSDSVMGGTRSLEIEEYFRPTRSSSLGTKINVVFTWMHILMAKRNARTYLLFT